MEAKSSSRSGDGADDRHQRQARALRANLARRKAQGRARADQDDALVPTPAQDGDAGAAGGGDPS